MARQNGTWVEYSTVGTEHEIERMFSSELRALRAAVANGNSTTFVQFGETIDEALARQASATKPNRKPTENTVTEKAAE